MQPNFPFYLNESVRMEEEDKRGDLGVGTVVGLSLTLTGIFISVAWGGSPGARSYRRTIERPGNLRRT